MERLDTAIAVLPDHLAAEAAIKKLAQGGFDLKSLSIVGKGYRSEERVTGFYNVGDRITMWGSRGAFWGGLWGLFFSGAFIGQFCEQPDDVVFTVEYSIRSAQNAVYGLLGLDRKPPPVYRGEFDPRVLYRAFLALHDKVA